MAIQNEAPTLAEALKQAIEDRMVDVHTSMPGRVEEYDPATQKARIQPLLMRKFKGKNPVALPPIPCVPVKWQRTENAIISLPLKPGDTGTLIFHERSLDAWLSMGGIVSPNDPRKHALTDAEFLPGLYPFSDPGPAEADTILITNKDMTVRIKPDGKIQIINASGKDLVEITERFVKTMKAAKVLTGIGLQPFDAATLTALATLETDIGTLKG